MLADQILKENITKKSRMLELISLYEVSFSASIREDFRQRISDTSTPNRQARNSFVLDLRMSQSSTSSYDPWISFPLSPRQLSLPSLPPPSPSSTRPHRPVREVARKHREQVNAAQQDEAESATIAESRRKQKETKKKKKSCSESGKRPFC